MENNLTENQEFNEVQSLKLVRQMIEISHKKLRTDGILFVVWGWIGFLSGFWQYLIRTYPHTYSLDQVSRWIITPLPVAGLIFTLVYLYRKSRKATTYLSISLRYVWISLFFTMVLINLIQYNVLDKIVFELQHPLFMVVTAFAIVITGGILRYRMIIAGGIIFAAMAYLGSCFDLPTQLLVESLAWFIAFVIPGHILFLRRNK